MKLSLRLKFVFVLILGIFYYSSSIAKSIFIDSLEAPPGFEIANIKQHIRVAVIFMGKSQGYFYVNLSHGKLQFDNPAYLLSKLTVLKKNEATLEILKQKFPLNMDCKNAMIKSTLCLALKKKSTYVIYNPKQETLYLFITHSYFIKPNQVNEISFIPDSTSEWSYINKLGGTSSYSNDTNAELSRTYASVPKYYNYYSSNILAYKNNSLFGSVSQNNGINDGSRLQIQSLFAQHISQDKVYSAGFIVNPTSPFIQTQTLLGAEVKSTLDTVKNADTITATPLVIFVPQASQVNIFKNEQLIFSQFLEAGYQRIQTTGFPEGGYELNIKIGANPSFHRFFSKGLFLPPKHLPQFYLVGGYLTNEMISNDVDYHFLPKVLPIPVVGMGLNYRTTEQMALSGDILWNSHQGLIDFGPTFFLGASSVKVATLITTKNNYGFYLMFNTYKNKLNLNFIATKIFYQNKNPRYYFLNNLVDNDSVSLSYNLSDYSLISLQGSYTSALDQTHSYNAGAFYQREIGSYKGMRLFLNAGYNKAIFVGDNYYLSLNISFSRDHLSGNESLVWQNQIKSKHDEQLASPVVVQGSTVYSQENEQNLGYTLNEIHTFSPTVNTLAGIYNYTAHPFFFATNANINQIKGQRHTLGYGASFETEIAMNKHGLRFNAIKRTQSAGVLIRVRSKVIQDKHAKFALMDEQNHQIATIRPNEAIFISLPIFTDQNFTLINLSKSDYSIEEPTRHITLYPGNVGYYSWVVEKRMIVIGRAVTKNKIPLSNTWIHVGNNGVYSDAEGYFQLELAQHTKTLETEVSCLIHLPNFKFDQAYQFIGNVRCV